MVMVIASTTMRLAHHVFVINHGLDNGVKIVSIVMLYHMNMQPDMDRVNINGCMCIYTHTRFIYSEIY